MRETISTVKESEKLTATKLVEKKQGFFYYLTHDWQLYALVAPGVIVLFIFSYIPIYGIVIAFQDFQPGLGFFNSKFVGLKHFLRFFRNPYCFRIIRNTFLLSFWGLLFSFPAPIILALMLNEVRNFRYKKITQTLSYLPHFISTVIIVGIVWRLFANRGVVNVVLVGLGLQPINFLVKNGWFRPIFIGSGIWTGIGWGSIIYLAALTAVDEEVYEAGVIDGANRFQRILHINIPAILPTITILLIFRMSSLLSVGFEKVYLMYNPAVYEVADVIATYVFREGIISGNYSYGAAVGLFNSMVAFLLIVGSNSFARRTGGTSLW